ncbi:MAG: arginine--tRNA ligase [Bacteroidetes bacterium]|nr:arginine--tRNA ligase [Bacteroidota bacterium]MDA0922180.1 arginine--tRNA ligase [Bacteroidota bacterium]MDA1287917.1 arginine--tRNA ligase [Bacteroidota bacterium]
MSAYLQQQLSPVIQSYFEAHQTIQPESFEFQSTRKDFEGDTTVLIFPLATQVKMNPEALGNAIGAYLKENSNDVADFNVVKGFLNLVLTDQFYLEQFQSIYSTPHFGHIKPTQNSPTLMVEFSSPNTNKPLHLGHIRNNVLGYAVANILEANGNHVVKTQIINDRGIHICKSMVAWLTYGNGETPASSGLKGDHLVGKYYVIFDAEYKKQIQALIAQGHSEEEAKQNAPLLLEAQEMLRKWESNEEEVRSLWRTMNEWVYSGFSSTYSHLGVTFDSYYYESDTYLLGKDTIAKGLDRGVLYTKEDGSVWIDLTEEGLDEKLLLRSDGTSVYMTQDLGTAQKRFEDVPSLSGMVYTVGNEQDYHFKVLFLILKKLGYSWADSLYHLSYGMVDLPSGKMKSREGTVVDADDLMKAMESEAERIATSAGKLEALTEDQKEALYTVLGLGALKYFILKVDPKKRILFDPEASIDFNGNTGPFIQYTHARIKTLLQRVGAATISWDAQLELDPREREVIKQLSRYPETLQQAALQYSPAVVANYIYDLVKAYNGFYQNISILGSKDSQLKNFRAALSQKVAGVIASSCGLLGIAVPDRM